MKTHGDSLTARFLTLLSQPTVFLTNTDFNQCLPGPCPSIAACTDLEVGYQCTCPSGFLYEGLYKFFAVISKADRLSQNDNTFCKVVNTDLQGQITYIHPTTIQPNLWIYVDVPRCTLNYRTRIRTSSADAFLWKRFTTCKLYDTFSIANVQ